MSVNTKVHFARALVLTIAVATTNSVVGIARFFKAAGPVIASASRKVAVAFKGAVNNVIEISKARANVSLALETVKKNTQHRELVRIALATRENDVIELEKALANAKIEVTKTEERYDTANATVNSSISALEIAEQNLTARLAK